MAVPVRAALLVPESEGVSDLVCDDAFDVAARPDGDGLGPADSADVAVAALAPAEPSSADRNVAAFADAQLAQAQSDLNAMKTAELRGEALDKLS